MKILIFISLSSLLLFTQCTQETVSPFTDTQQMNTTVVAGSWRITNFVDSGKDHTNLFTGYTFTFSTNGLISAVKGSTTITGSWATENEDSDLKLYLAFLSPSSFEGLTEDWRITSKTTTSKLVLEHISGGNGGSDYLTFEKN